MPAARWVREVLPGVPVRARKGRFRLATLAGFCLLARLASSVKELRAQLCNVGIMPANVCP